MNEIRKTPSPLRMMPADPCAGCDGRAACELSRPVARCCANCVCACPLALTCCGGTALVCANRPESPGELMVVECDDCCRNFRARRRPSIRTDPATLPEPPDDSIRYIPLTYGKFAMVDAADYGWLSRYRWHAMWSNGRFYAHRGSPNGANSVYMHREIMKPPPGMVVDHIDGNTLDQRRCNLRNCTQRQNTFNTRSYGGTSRFKGVSRRGDKWKARIIHDGKEIPLGMFDDEVEAARARDETARKLQREYAWLNFPEDVEQRTEDGRQRADGSQVAVLPNVGSPGDIGKRTAMETVTDAGVAPFLSFEGTGLRTREASHPGARSFACAQDDRFLMGNEFFPIRVGPIGSRASETRLFGPVRRAAVAGKAPRPAPWGHGPRVSIVWRRTLLTARGPPRGE